MKNVKIDPEFESLLPPLSVDEYKGLEQSILDEGCRDPLTAWNGTLVDGHNRYKICRVHGKSFEVRNKDFSSRDAAMAWMFAAQISRRNLTKEQVAYFRGKRYEMEKKTVGEHKGNQHSGIKMERGQNDPIPNVNTTADKLAEQYNVSPKTIKRDAKVAKAIDKIGETSPAAKQKILAGEVNINKKGLEKISIRHPKEVSEIAKQIESGEYTAPAKPTPSPKIDEVIRSIKDPDIAGATHMTCDSRASELANHILVFSRSLSEYVHGTDSIRGLSAESKKKITASIREMENAVISIKK